MAREMVGTRRKLLDGKSVSIVGGHHNQDMVDFLGQSGIDGVWIECEHGPVDWDEIGDFSRACDLWGMASIVRVPVGEPWVITRTLDRGASGIVVPHVNTAEQARRIGEAARFGPLGLRGMFGGRRSFGVKDYFARANDEVLVTVLVEEIEAVRNLPQILKEERVDVFFVAPSDLAQTMGHTGHIEHPDVQQTIDRAIKTIVDAGRVAGMNVTDENLAHYQEIGTRFFLTSWLPWALRGAQAYAAAVAKAKA